MPLISQIFGALFAGALVIVIGRQLGLERRRAFGAVALVTVSVAAMLAVPQLRDDVSALLAQRKEFVGLSTAEADNAQGTRYNINTAFFAWVKENLGEGETFYLEIAPLPDEETLEGGGVIQGTVFAWGTFQLGPHLLVEPASSADWIVFYGMNPQEYSGTLGETLTYEPNFAMARNVHAG